MLPKKITICNHEWDIKRVSDLKDDDGHPAYGLCEYELRTIYIDQDLKGVKRNTTFMHELFHAIIHEYSINQAKLSSDLEEVICDVFSNFLIDNFYWRTK